MLSCVQTCASNIQSRHVSPPQKFPHGTVLQWQPPPPIARHCCSVERCLATVAAALFRWRQRGQQLPINPAKHWALARCHVAPAPLDHLAPCLGCACYCCCCQHPPPAAPLLSQAPHSALWPQPRAVTSQVQQHCRSPCPLPCCCCWQPCLARMLAGSQGPQPQPAAESRLLLLLLLLACRRFAPLLPLLLLCLMPRAGPSVWCLLCCCWGLLGGCRGGRSGLCGCSTQDCWAHSEPCTRWRGRKHSTQ